MTWTRPILFSGPMVRAILEGRKTQTRRIVKPAPPPECGINYRLGNESWLKPEKRSRLRHHWEAWRGPLFERRPKRALCGVHQVVCPYGRPGDQLWVRETWRPEELRDGTDGVRFDADDAFVPIRNTRAASDAWLAAYRRSLRWRPSIHMPRWASRITLEVTDVRVERLGAITERDAQAEGVEPAACEPGCDCAEWSQERFRRGFAALWEEINGKRAPLASNPWVWVVEFRRLA